MHTTKSLKLINTKQERSDIKYTQYDLIYVSCKKRFIVLGVMMVNTMASASRVTQIVNHMLH